MSGLFSKFPYYRAPAREKTSYRGLTPTHTISHHSRSSSLAAVCFQRVQSRMPSTKY